MEIPKNIKNEICDYCRANNILNIDEFQIKLLTQGFTVEKFGSTPSTKEKIVEKIVEKIIEVPVEKIVEKIIEVPVTIVDSDLSNKLSEYVKLNEELRTKLHISNENNELLKRDLEELKLKNKKDLYGE